MRLGCEVVASDLNPVAWFILRCTLHYPHLLAGQRRALPEFTLDDEAFMAAFFKAQGVTGQRALREAVDAVGGRRGGQSANHASGTGLLPMAVETQADFAWHLRAWGRRALAEARRQLAGRYPTYAEFESAPRLGSARGRPGQGTSGKRVRLKMTAGANGVVFGVKSGVPVGRGSAARRRQRDRLLGAGTMSSSGVTVRAAASRRRWRICAPRAAPDAW